MTTEELAKRRAWAAIHFNQPNLTEAELDSGVFMPSENFSDGWDKGAEWALSSQWISVDERLPEKKERSVTLRCKLGTALCNRLEAHERLQ